MKKKAKKILARKTTPERPGKVGGRNPVSGQVNWSRVGRRRKDDDSTLINLAAELKKLREQRGVSVSKLAKELEIAPATLIKFEDKGHPVSIKVVSAFAQHLGCELQISRSARTGKAKKK